MEENSKKPLSIWKKALILAAVVGCFGFAAYEIVMIFAK